MVTFVKAATKRCSRNGLSQKDHNLQKMGSLLHKQLMKQGRMEGG